MDHTDPQRMEAQIREMARVIVAQAEAMDAYARFVELVTDRRAGERRQEPSGLGGVPGVDRRREDRRSGPGQ